MENKDKGEEFGYEIVLQGCHVALLHAEIFQEPHLADLTRNQPDLLNKIGDLLFLELVCSCDYYQSLTTD